MSTFPIVENLSTVPTPIDKSGWEHRTLLVRDMSKGELCAHIRVATTRIAQVKGEGSKARQRVKDAESMLETCLTTVCTDTLGDTVSIPDLIAAYQDRETARAGLVDLEYHFLEVFVDGAKNVLRLMHETIVSVNAKDGTPSFKPIKK